MQSLNNLKSKGQESWQRLVETGQQQPESVALWGATAGGAVVGAVALTVAASGILAVVATLAAPPVALTIGAIGGGLLGWNYMHSRQMTPPTFTPPDASVPGEATLVAEASFEELPKVATTPPASSAQALVVAAPDVDESLVLDTAAASATVGHETVIEPPAEAAALLSAEELTGNPPQPTADL